MATRKKDIDDGLGDFEGTPIAGVKLIINPGGSLGPAMEIAPVILHQGEMGYVLFRFETKGINFPKAKPKKNEKSWSPKVDRVQVIQADMGIIVDPELAAPLFAEMESRIAERELEKETAKRAAAGEMPLEL